MVSRFSPTFFASSTVLERIGEKIFVEEGRFEIKVPPLEINFFRSFWIIDFLRTNSFCINLSAKEISRLKFKAACKTDCLKLDELEIINGW